MNLYRFSCEKNYRKSVTGIIQSERRLFKAFNQECVDNISKSYLFAFVLRIRTITAISLVSEQCLR